MKTCALLILSLCAAVPALAQESGNRIYRNNGYYNQQRRQLQFNTGMLGTSNDSYAIEASVLTNLKPDAFVVVFGVNDEGSKVATSNEKANIDRSLIPHGAQVQISTLPSPWASKTFRATDIGVGIVGQHIDVFTGTGSTAQQETFRITSNNNRVCFASKAGADAPQGD